MGDDAGTADFSEAYSIESADGAIAYESYLEPPQPARIDEARPIVNSVRNAFRTRRRRNPRAGERRAGKAISEG
jgi:hypothetical protein